MHELYLVLSLVGSFTLLFTITSHCIKEKLFLSEALVATLFGLMIGPYGLGIFTWQTESSMDAIFYFSRLILAFQIMISGMNLPRAYLKNKIKSLSILLGPITLYGWIVSSLIVNLIFGNILCLTSCFVIGACISPTDPVLSNSILKGRFADQHIPMRLRFLISAESGLNDGIAFPLYFIPIVLMESNYSFYEFSLNWLLKIVCYNVLFPILFGCLIGTLARKALKFAETHNLVDKESFLVFSFSLALSTVGYMVLMKSNDLVAVFFVGTTLAWDNWIIEQTRGYQFQETIDLLFTISFFTLFGLHFPWNQLKNIPFHSSFLLCLMILLFRRLPAVIALYRFIPEVKTFQEAVFMGWFGPIGVGAIFYSYMAVKEFFGSSSIIYPIVCLIIMSSVILHGITVPLFHMTLIRATDLERVIIFVRPDRH